MTGRYIILKSGLPLIIGDSLYRTNSLSDAMDKVESLTKWGKAVYTICIISELSV